MNNSRIKCIYNYSRKFVVKSYAKNKDQMFPKEKDVFLKHFYF